MKKNFVSIAAYGIVALFTLTILIFSICVYCDYKVGAKNAMAKFEMLSAKTAETSELYPAGSKEFINAFNAILGAATTYEHLYLEVDGIEVYCYPAQAQGAHGAFVKSFGTHIVGGDGAAINLTANIYALSSVAVYNRAKIAFIIILAGTLLSCILLMYVYLSDSKPQEKFEDDDFSEDEDFEEPFVENEDSEKQKSQTSFQNEHDAHQKESEQNSATKNSSAFQTKEQNSSIAEVAQSDAGHLDANDLGAEKNFANDDGVAKNPEKQQKKPSDSENATSTSTQKIFGAKNIEVKAKDDRGLFSQSSGFGLEAYLLSRLESELVRATSSEQDLSLMFVQIPLLSQQSECYKHVCHVILDFFQYKELVFEYKENGFAIIIKDKDIDGAMECAETLYANLVSVLNKNHIKTKPLAGISSRSLRLISAERLKTEAEQALLRADGTESPIVAFRVDPEKYRRYIQSDA